MYQLYPPIFVVPEETNFPDSWEVFCCKLLNLENKTSEIHRRAPPEDGVDLFYSSKKTAYQCKSIEIGLTSGFNITVIKKSYQSAIAAKKAIGWESYVVCINIDLTGTQISNFKKELPEVQLLQKSYWVTLCEKFNEAVLGNFRKIIPVPPNKIEDKIDDSFYESYSNELKKLLKNDRFDLLLYCNRHSSVYRVPVSKALKLTDLLHILRGIFKLPPPTDFSNGVQVSLSYSIVHQNARLDLNKTIEDTGLTENSIITFFTKITYSQGTERASSTSMEMITLASLKRSLNPVGYALDEYKRMIEEQFRKVDEELLSDVLN